MTPGVVITGVGRRGQVGEAVAQAFARRSAPLVLLERDAVEVTLRADELRAVGAHVTPLVCDLTDAYATTAAAAQVNDLFPHGVSALVCLAGGFGLSGAVAESDPEVWDRQILINLKTAYLTTRAFLPLVRRARGSVVYFASAAVLPEGKPATMAAYAAAKAGVVALMRAVAAEERSHGVRANALAPTAIRTASNMADMGDAVSYVERETVAEWVVALCQPDGAVNGQVIKLG